MSVTLNVCVTCRAGEIVSEGQACAGRRLHAALSSLELPDGVEIVPVECLSACSRGATIALVSEGRWTYVFGPMIEGNAADILKGTQAYAATADGIVPWKERVEIFKKNVIARIPPMRKLEQ